MTPYSLVEAHQILVKIYYLHLQDRTVNRARSKHSLITSFTYSFALKMEAVNSSETKPNFYRTTRCYSPGNIMQRSVWKRNMNELRRYSISPTGCSVSSESAPEDIWHPDSIPRSLLRCGNVWTSILEPHPDSRWSYRSSVPALRKDTT
jgi:hypothetical protein